MDSDGDGIQDAADNCPSVPNWDQADSDRGGKGDACGPCIRDCGVPDNDGPWTRPGKPEYLSAPCDDCNVQGLCDAMDCEPAPRWADQPGAAGFPWSLVGWTGLGVLLASLVLVFLLRASLKDKE